MKWLSNEGLLTILELECSQKRRRKMLTVGHGCAIVTNEDDSFKVLNPGDEIAPWVVTQMMDPGTRNIRKNKGITYLITAQDILPAIVEEVPVNHFDDLRKMFAELQPGDLIEGPNGYSLAVKSTGKEEAMLYDIGAQQCKDYKISLDSLLVQFGLAVPKVHHKDDPSWSIKMKEIVSKPKS